MSKPTTHTPGPWFVSSIKGDDAIMVGAGDGSEVVADIRLADSFACGVRAEKNACLIAAAPELLSACMEALSSILLHDAGNLDGISTKPLETAIAHAQGFEWDYFKATTDNQGDPKNN